VAKGKIAQPFSNQTLRSIHSYFLEYIPLVFLNCLDSPPPFLYGVGCNGSPDIVIAAEEQSIFGFGL
jgi:hypothetical protein